jgi:DNA-directed RNA polymerase subunit RPC12/RpoP
MTEYLTLAASDLAADPEQANRQCGSCGKLYVVPENVGSYECLCGSRTLYPTVGGKVSAISWTPEVEAACRYKP